MERSDRIGVSVAAAGHVLLLAALSFGLFKAPEAPKVHQKSIDVSLVDAVALESATRSQAPAATAQAPEKGPIEEAAPAPTPEPEPKPVVKPAPPPPAPEPTPRPQPKPEPKPAPKPTPKPEPKPTPKPVPKPAEKPKPVAEKPTPQKTPPPKAKPAAAAPAPEPKKTTPAKEAAKPSPSTNKTTTPAKAAASSASKETAKSGAGEGKAEVARASRLGPNFLKGIADDSPAPPSRSSPAPLGADEARALNAEIARQLKPHWRAPTGADVDQLVTVLTWRLNRDGTIASGPTVVSQSGQTDTNRPQQQLHIEAAIRAVRAAAPFNLPPQFYDNWKYVSKFQFDRRL